MADCLIWCALAFLAGGGVGGLLMNNLVWRGQRRELAALARRLDEDERLWDGELERLRADYLARAGR
jgi:hypothetical protein